MESDVFPGKRSLPEPIWIAWEAENQLSGLWVHVLRGVLFLVGLRPSSALKPRLLPMRRNVEVKAVTKQ